MKFRLKLLYRPVSRLDAHHRLLISLGGAGLSALLLPRSLGAATIIVAVWLVYTLLSLGLTWITMLNAHPINLRTLTRRQDTSRTLSFLFIVLAAFASLGAIVLLFQSGAGSHQPNRSLHLLLSGLVVVSSWLLVHTVFTLRYAHMYYDDYPGSDSSAQKDFDGGLSFPNDSKPDYLDFAYFSFVIGMTSQVSDVSIESKAMRRLALVHGILSFFFNTSIIALSINTLSNALGSS